MSGFDAVAFQEATGVSRETLDRLIAYDGLLRKWQPKINLVGPSTLPDAWKRHFLDSAQLLPLIPEPDRPVVDIGTGAGFPGLVLAILGLPHVHLIEHNMQKIAFLQSVIQALDLPVTIHGKKVEAVKPFVAGTVTACEHVNLRVRRGEFLAVVGPSGCGKSTLLNMAAGLLAPSAGQVLYRGTPVPSPNTDVGYLTQRDTLLPQYARAGG